MYYGAIPIVAELEIKEHPQGNTKIQHGEDVTLRVSAIGPKPLTYRWKKDEAEIFDETNIDKLIITSFSNKDQGSYSCIVSGGQQSIETMSASLGLGMYKYIAIRYPVCMRKGFCHSRQQRNHQISTSRHLSDS